jgi:hypothetical protein
MTRMKSRELSVHMNTLKSEGPQQGHEFQHRLVRQHRVGAVEARMHCSGEVTARLFLVSRRCLAGEQHT